MLGAGVHVCVGVCVWVWGCDSSLLHTRPIKFLDSSPFRLIYCAAMSAWAADILKNVSDSSKYYRAQDQAILDAFDFFSEWLPIELRALG